jgi:hypothetical protein
MTKQTEALKLAFDALNEHEGNCWLEKDGVARLVKALDAIKEALAAQPAPMSQPNRLIAYSAADKLLELGYEWVDDAWKQVLAAPVQEWMKPHSKCDKACLFQCTKGFTQFPECATTPRAAQPAPVQEPLTWLKTIKTPGGFGKFVEAKPNEKGAKPVYLTPPAAQPEQEPVAHCEAGPEFCPVCRAETRSLALAAAVGYIQRNTPNLVWSEICNALTTTPPASKPAPCTWTQSPDPHMPDTYHATCGAVWTFTEGGPAENNVRFCPGCGGKLVEGDAA